MLTFKNTSRALVITAAILVSGIFFLHWPAWPISVALLIYMCILFFGSYSISAGFFLPVIARSDTTEKKIALSFDDGPDEHYTPQVLDILREKNIPAAFFCIGKKIKGREKIMQEIVNDGHLVGNHSFSHDFWFSMMPEETLVADLAAADRSIGDTIGMKPKLFRPPYGVTNPDISRAVRRGSYIAAGWSVRSLDTMISDESKLLARLLNRLKPGAVFLFHDTCASTIKVLPLFLKEIKTRGYVVERFDRLVKVKAYV